MKNFRNVKMITSLLLCMTLIMSYVSAFAVINSTLNLNSPYLTGVTSEEDAPHLSLVYMQPKESDANDFEVVPIPDDPTEIGKFYIGMKMTNFSKFTKMTTNNFQSASFTLIYDPTYIDIESTAVSDGDEESAAIRKRMLKYNSANNWFANSKGTKSNKVVYGYKYNTSIDMDYTTPDESGSAVEYPNYNGQNTDYTSGRWNALKIDIAVNDADFAKAKIADDYYAIIECDRITTAGIPDGGLTVFGISETTKKATIAWDDNVSFSYNNVNQPLQELLVLDASGADIFPKSYSVEFYGQDPVAATTSPIPALAGVGGTNVKSGTTSNPTTTTYPIVYPTPDANTFPATIGTDYFAGFKYHDSSNTETTFVPGTTVINAAAADGAVTDGNVVRLYPYYTAGDVINFDPNYVSGGAASASPMPASTTVPKVFPPATTPFPIEESDLPTIDKATATTAPEIIAPEGYKFGGWYDNAATTGTAKTFGATGDTFSNGDTLYAKWLESIDITFRNNDGTDADHMGASTVVSVSKGVQFDGTAPDNPTRVGYTFAGWSLTSNNSTGIAYANKAAVEAATFNDDTVLYAQWTPDDPVNMTFYPMRSDITVTPSIVSVNKGDKIYTPMIPNPTPPTDYTLGGWYNSQALNSTDLYDFDTGVGPMNTNAPAYAHWVYEGSDAVNVTFKDSDNTTDYAVIAMQPGKTFTQAFGAGSLPTGPEKAGYAFKEWNTDKDDTTSTTKFDENTQVDGAMVVYPIYLQDIEVSYDGNATDAQGVLPSPTVHPALDLYVAPTPNPTRSGYTFLGWNTKANGGGAWVNSLGANPTYGDIYTASKNTNGKVTLYAQWGAVGDDYEDDGPIETPAPTADPSKQGMKVTFDSNSTTAVTDASPKYKYPKYGSNLDAIGGLPDAPVREGYTFLGWNTKQDGTGTPASVTGSTTLDTTTVPDIVALEDGGTPTGGYELTLYAQWEANTDVVELKFHYNTDGKGGGTTKTYKIKAGDALGFKPTATNSYYDFNEWYEPSGTVTANTKVAFDTSKPFNKDSTSYTNQTNGYDFYAKWSLLMSWYVEETTTVEGTTDQKFAGGYYNRQEQKPQYTIYKVEEDSNSNYVKGETIQEHVVIDSNNNDFTVTYAGTSQGNNATVQAVDKYTPDLEVKAGSTFEDLNAEFTGDPRDGLTASDPGDSIYTILQAGLTIKVNPREQVTKSDASGVTKPTITVDGIISGDAQAQVYELKYYKWEDVAQTGQSAPDGKIQTSELSEITPTNWASLTSVGKYVIKVIAKTDNTVGKNYVVRSAPVADPEAAGDVLLYDGEQKTVHNADSTDSTYTYGDYPDVTQSESTASPKPDYLYGQNIVFEIKANDPAASDISAVIDIQPSGSPLPSPTTQPGQFLDSTLSSPKPFNSSPSPAPADREYYMIVPKTATDVDLTITPKNPGTTIKVTYGDDATAATSASAPTVSPTPLSQTGTPPVTPVSAKVPVDTTKEERVAAVTMTGEGGSPEITYLIHILTSKARIELEYGNSPYGMIEKMAKATQPWTPQDIIDAKAAFKPKTAIATQYFFGSQYIPDGAPKDQFGNTFGYSSDAWNKSTDPSENMDMNPYAIFIYQQKPFKDPGYTVYDAKGDKVTSPTVARAMDIYRLVSGQGITGNYTKESVTFTQPIGTAETDMTSTTKKIIRPDIYDMSYTYVDSITAEEIVVERKVILLALLGDVNLDNSVNTSDSGVTTKIGNKIEPEIPAGLDARIGRLYQFRIEDINLDASVNGSDSSYINSISNKNSSQPYIYTQLN